MTVILAIVLLLTFCWLRVIFINFSKFLQFLFCHRMVGQFTIEKLLIAYEVHQSVSAEVEEDGPREDA